MINLVTQILVANPQERMPTDVAPLQYS